MRALLTDAPLLSAGLSTKSATLAAEENGRLSILTAQLADGVQIGDDERLKGSLESLTIECHLTLENIAGLTGFDVHDLELALQDLQAVPADTKYALAIKSSYLIERHQSGSWVTIPKTGDQVWVLRRVAGLAARLRTGSARGYSHDVLSTASCCARRVRGGRAARRVGA